MAAADPFPQLRVRGPVRSMAVVLGDQLDEAAPVVRRLDRRRDALCMMEVAEEATHVPSHRQRTVLFLSAMRHWAMAMARRGYRVRYVRLDEPGNTQSLDGETRRLVAQLEPERLCLTHPGEWRVLEMAEGWRRDLDREVEVAPDEHFLTSLEAFGEWAAGRRSLVLEHFYRWQRRRLGVLVDDEGRPEGGAWNYDRENREVFDGPPRAPAPQRPRLDAITRAVIERVERRLPEAPGKLAGFAWPVTRGAARRALHDFIENRLPHFGTYQDAMWEDERTLYHARLSPALNLKLLNPRECVRAAIGAYERGKAPLNAVEGFVRQVIGWREFIRGVYWHEGRGYRRRNGLGQRGTLPDLYWSGETDMNCLAQCVGQVLDDAYGHHIQRLMVTGNFALLAGVHPAAVSDWYLGMYADGVDWATLPNTLGMAMHADGGVVGTKPYAASGRYIQRMSNYCQGCRYDTSRRSGESACPFNVLYWDFLFRNRTRLRGNQRMSMVLANADRLDAQEREAITRQARRIRKSLGVRLT